jgi:Cu(I)/Ag(I) efflux system membrane fusion protein
MAARSIRSILIRNSALAATLALLAMASACAAGKRPSGEPLLTGHSSGLSWNLWLSPDPPKQKGNTVWVEVLGGDGKPVVDADVTLGWVMPAMGSMPEMKGNADVIKEGPGLFRITFDFPTNGTWTLDLTITTPQSSAKGEYTATVGSKGLKDLGGTSGDQSVAPAPTAEPVTLTPIELPAPALESLRTALGAYDEARGLLAADSIDGLAARAARLEQSLRAARQALGATARADVARLLDDGAGAAAALREAKDLESARTALGNASRSLIGLAGADPRLAAGWQAYSCPMTTTFPKWMQPGNQKQNPYLGKAMSTCGSPTDWKVPLPASSAAASPTAATNSAAAVRMDTARRQAVGVTTAVVSRRPLAVPIRAVGKVVFDETKLTDVTVKYKGFIGRLYVDRPGQPVRRGQPLFTLYSPELYAAQQEYLIALRSQRDAHGTGAPDRADYLVTAARQRLRLWDLQPAQIDRLAQTGKAVEEVPILSPASGYVVEKEVVAGGAVEPGMKLFRLAGLDTVWVEAEVYESELPLVHVGDTATVSFPYLPGRSFAGTIGFVYPYLDAASRTGRVRIQLPNGDLELKPDMFANVTLTKSLGARLAVAADAVLYAGDRSFVFVDLGDGRLVPRRVVVGQTAGDFVEVLDGLREGETIVTSGNFLVAAESRLKLAMEQWR